MERMSIISSIPFDGWRHAKSGAVKRIPENEQELFCCDLMHAAKEARRRRVILDPPIQSMG